MPAFVKLNNSLTRHILKTISWRMVGTIDTILVSWLVSGNIHTGLKIGGLEVGTKMLLYFLHERAWYKVRFGTPKSMAQTQEGNTHVVHQAMNVQREHRSALMSHKPLVVWMTGLSGSGKSTLANALMDRLHMQRIHTFSLDGDNVRLGLNKDLGFSNESRTENIRRVAEVAKLMADAGLVVVVSFISPFKADREQAKQIVGESDFVEVHVDCDLSECERRDIKGLYRKARQGEIKEFTGISSPYEAPEAPHMTVHTAKQSIEECTNQLSTFILHKIQA
ncbi:MAG: adenylyl-sulfate kinase [Chitinophagaceae bacterium]